MKREILCPSCGRMVQTRYPTSEPYPGEYLKISKGRAKANFSCDHCNAPISRGDVCMACSQWTQRGLNPYFPWEHEYITKQPHTKVVMSSDIAKHPTHSLSPKDYIDTDD